ncbi:hypothetical protein OHR68_19810 [Spirillospora sp. NBC_00431]
MLVLTFPGAGVKHKTPIALYNSRRSRRFRFTITAGDCFTPGFHVSLSLWPDAAIFSPTSICDLSRGCQSWRSACRLDGMGRPEKPLDPAAGPVEEFAAALRELRNNAGRPTYRVLAGRCGVSVTALTAAARGDRLPTLKVALAFAQACGADRAEWERRWHAADAAAVAAANRVGEVDADGREPKSPAPYLGLASYEAEDADRFFGRDELVADIVGQLEGTRVVAVVGPSGSGKSSVLRAGVIPAARRAATEPLTVALLTPGADPLAALACALSPAPGPTLEAALPDAGATPDQAEGGADLAEWARRTGALPDGGDLLVVVDQFEEVFTLCTDPGKRTAFIDVLLSARAPGSRVRVALGLRADFFGRCAGHRGLAAALRTGTVLVAPMSAAELREVIVKPAARMQVMVEPALVATIVAEATGEPGMLPLVSHALRETWRRRRGRTLSLHAYRSTGGIHGAVAQSAETLWAALPAGQRQIARRILLRLVTVDADGQATRRPLAYADLPGGTEHLRDHPRPVPSGPAARGVDADGAGEDQVDGEVVGAVGGRDQSGCDNRDGSGRESGDRGGAGGDAGRVLEVLAGARLVNVDEREVRLVHEALITAWPRLRDWVEQDRAGLRVRQQITEAARTWRDLDRDPDVLLRGSRLAIAREWAERDDNATTLTAGERAFLAAAITAEQTEQATIRRRTRRLRALSAALAVLLLAATLAGAVAVRQSRLALARQHQAQSRELAGRATLAAETDPVEAIRLAMAAYRHAPTTEARGSLLSAAATMRFKTGLRGAVQPVSAVALSHDGVWLAAVSNPNRFSGGRVEIWSTLSGKIVARLDQVRVSALAFSPDGRRLVTAGPAGDGPHAEVSVWDLTRRRRIAASTIPLSSPYAVAFDATGRALAAGSPPRQVWDVTTSTPAPITDRNALPPGLLTDDSLDGRIHARTARIKQQDINQVGLDDDKESRDRQAKIITVPTEIVDRRTGRSLWTLNDVRKRATDITDWLLSDDGRVLYLADTVNEQIIVWDLVRRSRLPAPEAGLGGLEHLAQSMDGRLLVSVSRRGDIDIHDLRPQFPLGHTDTVVSLAYSPDGRTLASIGDTYTRIHLRDPTTHGLYGLLPASSQKPVSVADLARDPRTRNLTIKGAALRSFNRGRWKYGLEPCSQGVIVNSAGTQLACAALSEIFFLDIRLLNKPHHNGRVSVEELFPFTFDEGEPVRGLFYSPDGKRLAVLNNRGQLGICDTASFGASPLPLTQPPPSRAVAFSPDGRLLALGGDDRTITLWDLKHRTLWATLTGHTQAVTSLAFSPDGQSLASGSADHTIITWPLNTTTTARNRLKYLLDTNNGPQP